MVVIVNLIQKGRTLPLYFFFFFSI